MKKRLFVVAALAVTILPIEGNANTFEPLGWRTFAREIGIGCGQGYHSKPVPAQLRPYYERVTNYQAWRVCPPPAYPDSSAAPVSVHAPATWNDFRADSDFPGRYVSSPDSLLPAEIRDESLPTFSMPQTNPDISHSHMGDRFDHRPTRKRTEPLPLPSDADQESTRNRERTFRRDDGHTEDDQSRSSIIRRFTKRAKIEDDQSADASCSETRTDALTRRLEQYEAEADDIGLNLRAKSVPPPFRQPEPSEEPQPPAEPSGAAEPSLTGDDSAGRTYSQPSRDYRSEQVFTSKGRLPFSTASPSVDLDSQTTDQSPLPAPNEVSRDASSLGPGYPPLPTSAWPAPRPQQAQSTPGPGMEYWQPVTRPPATPKTPRPPASRSYGNPTIWW